MGARGIDFIVASFMEGMGTLVIGLISGIISAIIVHLLLKRTAPKVIISDHIEKKYCADGKYHYHVKVVNLRKRFVGSVTPYFDLIQTVNGQDGRILRVKTLKIHVEDIPYIDPYCKKDEDSKYAVRVELPEDIEALWENDSQQKLQLRLYCVDEFSGAGKFFQQSYYRRNCIVEGEFRTGKSTKII